jgi:DNA-binding NarL/FixJ family response regulator
MKPTAIILGEVSFSLHALAELVEIQSHMEPGTCPDVVILAENLDILKGVEICRRLTQRCPKAKLIVLTDSDHATKYQNQLIRAGAHGFCLFSSGVNELLDAVRSVLSGDIFFSPQIQQLPKFSRHIQQLVKLSPTTSMPNCPLTDREIQVIKLINFKNGAIAEVLNMKHRTVEKHIECIFAKLKVNTKAAAAQAAIELGLIVLPPPDQD